MAWDTTNWAWRCLKPETGKAPRRNLKRRWARTPLGGRTFLAGRSLCPHRSRSGSHDGTRHHSCINSDHYRANLLRGRILSLQGKPDDALPNLQKAATVQPDSKEAHLFLSHAYTQLNRDADAAQERAKAQALR